MDYANALNTALGLKETPEVKVKKHAELFPTVARQLGKSQANMIPAPIKQELFDIATYVPNQYLQEALKRFPGSVLNVNPINGAVEFIFGKQTS